MIMQRDWWLVSHAALWNSDKRLLYVAIMFLHTTREAQFVQNVRGDNIRWMIIFKNFAKIFDLNLLFHIQYSSIC